MVKVGVLGISAAFLALILRKEKAEFAIAVILMAGILIFAYAIAKVSQIMDFLQTFMDHLPFEANYLWILFRMLGVAYVAEFAANICKDAGYQSVAGQIEAFAKLSIVAMSIPCLSYLIGVVGEIL